MLVLQGLGPCQKLTSCKPDLYVRAVPTDKACALAAAHSLNSLAGCIEWHSQENLLHQLDEEQPECYCAPHSKLLDYVDTVEHAEAHIIIC